MGVSLGCAIVVAAAVLVSACVVRWCLRWSQLGEHNEADLSKRIDSALFLKGTPFSTTNEFIELELTDGGSEFPTVVCQSGM